MSPLLIMLNREVRRIPMDWQHPRDEHGYTPLHDRSYDDALAEWKRDAAAWARGEFPDYADAESRAMTYEEWDGPGPDPSNYMPTWPDETELGICMYETTTEGTPISAVYEDTDEGRRAMAEELADPEKDSGVTSGLSVADWLDVIEGQVLARDIHTGQLS